MKFPIVEDEVQVQEELYYYISYETFVEKVLSEGSRLSILFSDINDYEDEDEYKLGRDQLESIPKLDDAYVLNADVIKKKNPFQLSLSKAKDSYPMWKIYGKGDPGIMLSFNSEKLLNSIRKDSPKAKLAHCVYYGTDDAIEMSNYLQTGISVPDNGFIDYYDQLNIAAIPFLLKNKAYGYEQEVRLFNIALPTRFHLSEKMDSIVLEKGRRFRQIYLDSSVLNSIVIGPCTDDIYKEKYSFLMKVIKGNSFSLPPGCSIDHSSIPIRRAHAKDEIRTIIICPTSI